MNQENNQFNQNNFNTQGNNGIPNNQPLQNNQSFNTYSQNLQQGVNVSEQTFNNQQSINQTNMQQSTTQPVNTIDNRNNNNQSFNGKPPKKMNLGLIIGTISAVIIAGIVGTILILNNNSKSTNSDNNYDNTENNAQKEDESDTLPNEINKYWNINTKEFNASLFDGKFSIGGDVVQSKLTGKTLKENGYVLRIGSGLFKELLWDKENNVYSDKSNGAYILKNNEELLGNIYLENYKNETNLYSDNTEISYYWNDITETYNDIIIPTCLINKSEELVYKTLTIDNIVDKLGAPTYVQGRLTKSIENGEFFKYVYVYNDYTLWFEMLYYKNQGITVTGFRYEGNQSFNQPCKYYDADIDEFREYNKSLDYLNEEQTKYEKSL